MTLVPTKGWRPRPHVKFTAPAMIIVLLLSAVPTVFLFAVSLTNYQLGWDFSRAKFVGLSNFTRLLTGADPDFWHSVAISLAFMVLATGFEMVLGFGFAHALNAWESRLKPLVIGIMIIPLALTPSIAAQMWKLMFNAEYGLINAVLGALFDWKVTWLGSGMAFWSVLIVDAWQFTPFVALILYAGLRSLPQEPYEAAQVDGASAWERTWYLTIPMLRKLIFLALLLRVVDSLKLFDTVFVLTQGGPGNSTMFLSMLIFRLVNAQNGLIGRGSAVALILIVLVIAISRPLIKLQRKEA